MDLYILILTSLNFLILAFLFFYFKKLSVEHSELIESKGKAQLSNIDSKLNTIKTRYFDTIDKELKDLKSKYLDISNNLPDSEQLSQLNKSLKHIENTTHAKKQKEIQIWIEGVNQSNNDEKLEYLEAAFLRFPGEIRFIEMIKKELFPLATKADNILIRREALLRIKAHSDAFYKNCSPMELNKAIELKNDIYIAIESTARALDKKRGEQLDDILKKMSGLITKLKKSPSNESLINEIEKLDKQIDHDYLSEYDKGKNRYEKLSKDMITILNKNESDGNQDLKKYNIDVLNSAKRAFKMMQNHSEGKLRDSFFGPDKPVNYNNQSEMKKLIKLISVKDPDKLLPTTKNYLRIVEAEILNKLNADGQVSFTKLMINNN